MDDEFSLDDVAADSMTFHSDDTSIKIVTMKGDIPVDRGAADTIEAPVPEPTEEFDEDFTETPSAEAVKNITLAVPADYKLSPIWGQISADARAKVLTAAATMISLGLAPPRPAASAQLEKKTTWWNEPVTEIPPETLRPKPAAIRKILADAGITTSSRSKVPATSPKPVLMESKVAAVPRKPTAALGKPPTAPSKPAAPKVKEEPKNVPVEFTDAAFDAIFD